MITFGQPWFLVLLGVIPLIWWAHLSPRRRAAIRFSSVDRVKEGVTPISMYARHVPPVLRSLAVALVVLAIARPQKADEETRISTEGIAIQLVLDRSGSMKNEDFIDAAGRRLTRLDAVKNVVRQFVEGDGEEMKGRDDDLVGLIVFARYADTECPLTHDHKQVIRALERVEVPTTRDEDGTAIGDALLLGVERTRNIARRFGEDDAFKIKSRVIILLTDGEQNFGKYLPSEAAEAAAAVGVKVYTIGAAPDYQEQSVGGLLFQPRTVRVPVQVNEEELQKVASITGGKYFRARDADSLKAIYEEIDRLERTTIDRESFFRYEELAYKWFHIGEVKLPPPLLVALLLLGLELLLVNTRLRRIP